MNDLRKDYALNRWVIIAEKRKARPRQFGKLEIAKGETDFFAPGNESMTPPEIGRVEHKGSWLLRWFPNKFAAASLKNKFKLKKGFFSSAPAYGHHEVIVETPTDKQLWDLEADDVYELLKVYSLRTESLMKEKDVQFVSIFKNHGRQGGTSLIHSHSQVITSPILPPYLVEKAKRYTKSVIDRMIMLEKNSPRKIRETKHFLAFCPYASRFNYEAWIYPKGHIKSITEFGDAELEELAGILNRLLKNLRNLCDSYNILVNSSPKGLNMRFHIEILPRAATWAGFEYASGIVINSVSPESAARELRK